MKKLPKARNKQILVRRWEKEILIYDLQNNKTFCLNEITSMVWIKCDGETNISDFIAENNLNEELIQIALSEMTKNHLLEDKVEVNIPTDKIERRKFLIKAGALSTIALPIISTVLAPSAAEAQSCIANGNSATLAPPTTTPDLSSCGTYCQDFAAPQCCSGNVGIAFDYDSATQACRCLTANCSTVINSPN